MALSRSCLLLIIAAALTGPALLVCQQTIAQSTAKQASAASLADEAQEARPNRIQFEYVPPQNPQLEVVYTQLKQGHALEKIQQLFSPFRIPIDLTVKTVECGRSNAWYQRPTVTLCYEYLDEIWRSAPKQPGPAGVTPVDAVVGQFFYVVAHEFGHAMFDVLQVPSFGSAEDAADEFSTFMMLHLGKDDARRLISGAAYSYRNTVQDSASIVALQAFSDMHSMPAQRFFNLLCIAYGADPITFAHVVEEKYLPESRARDCKREYDEVAFAFKNLIGPHLDQDFVKQALRQDWLPPESPKPVGK
jgi:Putative metallopeptidase